ncbi:hypothetical protein KJ564_10490 [bacterium]|nr:hypothetical protein [bacterium]
MKGNSGNQNRRTGVVLNYLCLIFLLLFYNTAEAMGWNIFLITGIAVALAFGIYTFISIYLRTGLWKLIHAKSEQLDEREIQLTRTAVTQAYSVFAILCLLLFYLELFVLKGSLGALNIASLIYLAHVLPQSIIAWHENTPTP